MKCQVFLESHAAQRILLLCDDPNTVRGRLILLLGV
jgi:hypothetical protein